MYHKKYVPRSKGEMLYTSSFGFRDIWPKLWNLVIYISTYALWLYLDSAYYNFGSKIITPLTGAMWIVGAVLAILLPSQKQDIIKHTKWFVLGYLAILFIYRYVIILVSGVSAENLSASCSVRKVTFWHRLGEHGIRFQARLAFALLRKMRQGASAFAE